MTTQKNLMRKLIQASEAISKASTRGSGNWIMVGSNNPFYKKNLDRAEKMAQILNDLDYDIQNKKID
jgi:hypothetical protein